ncbi:hypothetical protein [Arthrobacter sp. L77]|nr:hypothetical protein [Arthrobacter sp. L77]
MLTASTRCSYLFVSAILHLPLLRRPPASRHAPARNIAPPAPTPSPTS